MQGFNHKKKLGSIAAKPIHLNCLECALYKMAAKSGLFCFRYSFSLELRNRKVFKGFVEF